MNGFLFDCREPEPISPFHSGRLKTFSTELGQPLFARWPIFFLLAIAGWLFLAPPAADAQRRLAPRPIPYSQLDKEEGEKRLSELRRFSFPTVYGFRFDVRAMPRRGEERRFSGRLWGDRDEKGPVARYEIARGQDREPLRFLVRGGDEPEIWEYDAELPERGVVLLETEELFHEIEGTDFSPFDLQMPFLFWREFDYEGLRRLQARSSHIFLMHPPEEFALAYPRLSGVRMYLDAEFNALLGADLLDAEGDELKTFRIAEIKRLGDDWLVRAIDYRDVRTGNRTRMTIRSAAIDLPGEPFDFSPEALDRPFPEVPRERFSRL